MLDTVNSETRFDRLEHVRKDSLGNAIFDLEGDMREVKDHALLLYECLTQAGPLDAYMRGALCRPAAELLRLGETLDQAFDLLSALSRRAEIEPFKEFAGLVAKMPPDKRQALSTLIEWITGRQS